MGNFSNTFNILFIIIPIIGLLIFGFVIAMFISPKFRGKIMSRQIKAAKYMTDYSKDDIEDIGATLGKVTVTTKKRILDENGDVLEEISTKEGNISKEKIKTIASAIKEGLDEASMYCKHCGSSIDVDSKFCKKCGKEQ